MRKKKDTYEIRVGVDPTARTQTGIEKGKPCTTERCLSWNQFLFSFRSTIVGSTRQSALVVSMMLGRSRVNVAGQRNGRTACQAKSQECARGEQKTHNSQGKLGYQEVLVL